MFMRSLSTRHPGAEHQVHALGSAQPAREWLRGQRLHAGGGILYLQQASPALGHRVGALWQPGPGFLPGVQLLFNLDSAHELSKPNKRFAAGGERHG